jgi:hypothetical protein
MIIHYRTGTVGVHTSVKPGVIIMYDIIESNVQGENVPIKVNFGANVVILAHVRFSGRVRILKAEVDFATLVTCCAQNLEGKVKKEYENIKKERPLTAFGRAYLARQRFGSGGDLETCFGAKHVVKQADIL